MRDEIEALRERAAALRAELELTEFYASQLKERVNVPHRPPRVKWQSKQFLLRGLLIGAVGGGAATSSRPVMADVAARARLEAARCAQ